MKAERETRIPFEDSDHDSVCGEAVVGVLRMNVDRNPVTRLALELVSENLHSTDRDVPADSFEDFLIVLNEESGDERFSHGPAAIRFLDDGWCFVENLLVLGKITQDFPLFHPRDEDHGLSVDPVFSEKLL